MKNRCWMLLPSLIVCLAVAGCAGSGNYEDGYYMPTVDYVEGLNVNDAPHQESFLNQLAMNYRSYAMYNARTSGYPDVAELFAQKAVSAFSGETPYPESLDNWEIDDESERFEIYSAYNDLMDELKNDVVATEPKLAAEAQAKFDCWISAASSGQIATAKECEKRFRMTLETLQDCDHGHIVEPTHVMSESVMPEPEPVVEERYYPETRRLSAMAGVSRSREGVMIINNVNVPANLVQPIPVPQREQQPQMIFNQNIYGGEENINGGSDTFNNTEDNSSSAEGCPAVVIEESQKSESCNECNECSRAKETPTYPGVHNVEVNVTTPAQSCPAAVCPACKECNECEKCSREGKCSESCPACEKCEKCKEAEPCPKFDDYVTRDEFIDLMNSLRAELAAINARLDGINNKPVPVPSNEKTVIKVQQIPLEPKQRIMEEIFEIRFDFNKSIIKPEYEEIIKKLVATTQANKNVKVSVVGHTDTAGSSSYNYALGGRRAEAVQKMLIEYGIPSSQIIAVSAGEEDLKVKTPDNTPNAENRRVRVVKEVQFTEQPKPAPVVVEEYTEIDDCEECDEEE